MGIFNNYKEKLSVLRVQTASSIEPSATAPSKLYPSELLSVQNQTSIV